MTEEIGRDLERVEEYEHTTSRASFLGENKVELSTGLIIAARYADKMRRIALVALGRLVPREVIVRDVAELNKQLYDILVNKMKVGKLDVVRIVVDAAYKEAEKRLVFSNIRVTRYYTEEECKGLAEGDLKKRVEQLEKENNKLKDELKKIRETLSAVIREAE
jgi:hypothetical protein